MTEALDPQQRVEKILWGLANFFLQIFVWGLTTALLVFWGATFWEGFGFLAVITGAMGIVLAVLPLWRILYPSSKQRTARKIPDWLWKFLVFAALFIALMIVALLLSTFG